MSRGSVPVVTVVFLLAIGVATVSVSYVVVSDIQEQGHEAMKEQLEATTDSSSLCITIENASCDSIYIRNCGSAVVDKNDLDLYVDGLPVSTTISDDILEYDVGVLAITENISEGDHTFEVSCGKAFSITTVKCGEPDVPCVDDCTLGDLQCSGNDTEECADCDVDSCYEWCFVQHCDYGCEAGLCLPCEPYCDWGSVETCVETISDGCGGTCTRNTNGTSCNDSYYCTVNGVCQSGVCQGESRNCSGFSDPCNDGICNEYTDACEADPTNYEGLSCNDENPCTINDLCSGGVCSGTEMQCPDYCAANRSYHSGYCSGGTCQYNTTQCGTSYCESWSEPYCSGSLIVHSRICHDAGCSSGSCYDNNYTENEVVPSCLEGEKCYKAHCVDGDLYIPSYCYNEITDGDESDVDCGGSCPLRCANGQSCNVNADCAGNTCAGGLCARVSKAPGAWSDYWFSSGSLSEIEMYFTWLKEPGFSYIYSAFTFGFEPTGGYTGLQQVGNTKKVLFSIWDIPTDITANPAHANCGRFGGEGTGAKCIMDYNWVEGHEYRLRVERNSTNESGDIWAGYIKDMVMGEETIIGKIFLENVYGLVGYGLIKAHTAIFLEYFGGVSYCDENIPHTKVIWRGPYTNGVPAYKGETFYINHDCNYRNVYSPQKYHIVHEGGGEFAWKNVAEVHWNN